MSPPTDDEVNDHGDVNASNAHNHTSEPELAARVAKLKLASIAQLSNKVEDLKISVPSFCKAFPWHFLTDKNLEIVQLGSGFMKLFGRQLNQLGE